MSWKSFGGMGEVIAIGICAALCEQLMDRNRYFGVIRVVMSLQIAGIMIKMLSGIAGPG